ncbi:hypothetical protein V8C86DRAFT_2912420 [Haematococcus lacustris]
MGLCCGKLLPNAPAPSSVPRSVRPEGSESFLQTFLSALHLECYTANFEDAGFSDRDLLCLLTEDDLQQIEAHGHISIPPGHRKKLLLGAKLISKVHAQPPAPLPP